MTRPRVKICGITRAEDAAAAVRLGADALGFVFWPKSPRVVSIQEAASIVRTLPPFVTRVGVFVNAAIDDVVETVRSVGLDAVQLHGDEAPWAYRAVPARIIRATPLSTDDDVRRAAELPPEITPLVDVADEERRGGTGRVADWPRAARLAFVRPIILAGGLVAGNVAEAVASVRPWAVDVSSGVEERPRVKSETRLEEFLAAVAAIDRR